jgi:hypothetical protein
MNRNIFDEKDLFELFNYIDESDKEEEPDLKIDDLRKMKLKKKILKQVKSRNHKRKFIHKIAAVAIMITFVFLIIKVPILAKNIPVLKSIIQDIYGNKSDDLQYEKYSQNINKSVTDKGITLTINEALCDGNSLMLGYTIKTAGDIRKLVIKGQKVIERQAKDSSFVPFFIERYSKINGQIAVSGSSYEGKYRDEHTYVNSEIMDIGDKNLPDMFKVDVNVTDIYGVKGKWNFQFNVSKKQMLKNTVSYNINSSVKMPDAYLNVKKVIFTPIGTYIQITGKYSKKEYKDPDKRQKAFKQDIIMGNMLYDECFVIDDSGNEIQLKGSSGGRSENSVSSDFWYAYRFENVKTIPKYITVIPYKMNYSKTETSTEPVYKNINGKYPIELKQGNMGKIVVNSIEYKKDTTIARCTVEGKAPFLQVREFYILDDENNQVERKNIDYKIKKDSQNSTEYILEFGPMNPKKKYKIATNDLSLYDIRTDLKFKVQLQN